MVTFPNVFITITAAEWKFPRPYFILAYQKAVFAGAYCMALHMQYLVRSIWSLLSSRHGNKFFTVYEWVSKTEYQGQGTLHWHLAAWVLTHVPLSELAGRSETQIISAFVKLLMDFFLCTIDAQVNNKRLNYINGYPISLLPGRASERF